MKLAPLFVFVVLVVLGSGAAYVMLSSSETDSTTGTSVGDADSDRDETPETPHVDDLTPAEVLASSSVRTLLAEGEDALDVPPSSMLTATVSVEVVDERTKAPVEGAKVEIRSGGATYGKKLPVPFVDFASDLESDARGSVALKVPTVGVFVVVVTKEGYAPKELGPVMPNDRITLQLTPGNLLSGRIVDAENGAPVAGSVVRAKSGGLEAETESDADGRFVVADLPAGLFGIEILADGYDLATLAGIQVGTSAVVEVEVELQAGATLLGHVIDAGDGSDLAGVQLTASIRRSREGEKVQYLLVEATSDNDGMFRIDGVSRRDIDLQATFPGFAPFSNRLKIDAETTEHEIELKLIRGTSIAGRVVDPDGVGVSDAQVRIGGVSEYDVADRTVKTDASGEFRFVDVAPGIRFQLVAVSPDKKLAPGWAKDLMVNAQQPLEGVSIALARSATVKGSVVDASARPVPHARVTIEGLSYLMLRALGMGAIQYADEEGLFLLEGMPAERIVLSASRGEILSPAASVALNEGVEHEVRLRLIGGLTLGGVVTDRSGRPIDDVLITAYSQDPDLSLPTGRLDEADSQRSRALIKSLTARKDNAGERVLDSVTGGKATSTAFKGLARSEEDGRFELTGLPEGGLVAIVLQHEDFTTAYKFSVPTSAGEVRIEMSPMLALTGRVLDASNRRPVKQFVVTAKPTRTDGELQTLDKILEQLPTAQSFFQSADGTFELTGLQPGRYSVIVRSEGYKKMEPEEAKLSFNSPSRIEIELTPGATVTGRVVNDRGEPVARVPVFLKQVVGTSAFSTVDDAKAAAPRVVRKTDFHGEFRIIDVDAGTYDIGVGNISAPIAGPVQMVIGEGEHVEREFKLGGTGSIEVSVRGSNGFGLANADVTVRGIESGLSVRRRSDGSGKARFDTILAEPCLLLVSHPDHKGHKEEVKVQPHDKLRLEVTMESKKN